ncbi:MAG: hypothetical protein J6K20_08580 [Thermoguttaceae bacterium]|nr:hypothetical protein [Thermoguttaceae bacterium]
MKRLRWEAALVGLVALAATLAATERTPLTWDEGDAFVRAERVAAWTRAVVVGPQKLRETFKANEGDKVDKGKSGNGAGFNGVSESAAVADDKASRATSETSGNSEISETLENSENSKNSGDLGSPKDSTQTAPLNDETCEKEAKERREERERPLWGDVERAALEYFSRFDGRRALFSERAVEAGWSHAIYREGHPAGYSIAIAAGRAFSLRFLPFLSEKAAFRFGPICLFALALAAVFYRVGRNWGRFAAILAVAGIVSIPRAFGHAQLAGGDSLLISSWLLAWAFFDAALASKRGAILLGGAVGVSFCAKFSGFAVVAPLASGAVAALWLRRREKMGALGGTREVGGLGKEGGTENVSGKRRDGVGAATGRLALAAVVAAAAFWAANPPLWARPFEGFETFVSLNLRRDGFDIPIYFLGKFYSPSRPLPWWNGFFWLATTVPTALLAFAAFGTVATTFGRDGKNGALGKIGGVGANDVKGASGESGDGRADSANRGNTANKANDENNENAKTAKNGRETKKERDGDGSGDLERRGRLAAGLALAFAVTLPLARVIPGIPTHDGARLIIASFPFVAILAAFGATVFVERCERTAAFSGRARRQTAATLDAVVDKIAKLERQSATETKNETRERIWNEWEEWRRREEPSKRKRNARAARRLAQVGVAAAFAVGVVDLVRSAPQYLSFYNATLGGVVGATRRGMEATYYWDAFDADAVAWLNAEIAAARADGRPTGVLFGSFSSQTLDYYRRWGTLATSEIETISTPTAFVNRERFGFYVVQRRPSGWTALELALFKTARPIYRKTVRNPLGLPPFGARREVVLLEIYDFRDVERVLASAARAQEKKATAR